MNNQLQPSRLTDHHANYLAMWRAAMRAAQAIACPQERGARTREVWETIDFSTDMWPLAMDITFHAEGGGLRGMLPCATGEHAWRNINVGGVQVATPATFDLTATYRAWLCKRHGQAAVEAAEAARLHLYEFTGIVSLV